MNQPDNRIKKDYQTIKLDGQFQSGALHFAPIWRGLNYRLLFAVSPQWLLAIKTDRFVLLLTIVLWCVAAPAHAKRDSLNNAAVVHAQQGDFVTAASLFLQSYENALADGNDSGLCLVAGNLGSVFFTLKDYDKAEKYYGISREQAEELNWFQQAIEASHNLASVEQLRGNYDEAIAINLRVYELAQSMGDSAMMLTVLHNVGSIYGQQEQLDSALEYYLKALKMQEYAEGFMRPNLYANIATCYWQRKEHDLALVYFRESVAQADSLGFPIPKRLAYDGMTKLFRELNQHDSAWKYNELEVLLGDSLYNVEVRTQAAELELQYQTEKQARENAELQVTATQQALDIESQKRMVQGLIGGTLLLLLVIVLLVLRQRAKAQKREAQFLQKRVELEQQALRARMNPHFLFNSLASIQQLYSTGNTTEANEFLGRFSQLLRRILNHTGIREISVHDEVETLKLYLKLEQERMQDALEWELTIDPEIPDMVLMMPPMVVQPFVENAIWHGLGPKGSGRITIDFAMHSEDRLDCTITDDGVGIDVSRQQKKQYHKSKGIELTNERLAAGGGIEVVQLPEGGTRATLKIPVNYGN